MNNSIRQEQYTRPNSNIEETLLARFEDLIDLAMRTEEFHSIKTAPKLFDLYVETAGLIRAEKYFRRYLSKDGD